MGNNTGENKKKLEQLKEMLGEDNFLKLTERFAGMTLYFSKKSRLGKMTVLSKGSKKTN